MDVARALHIVQYAEDTPRRAVECQYNPGEVDICQPAGSISGGKRQRRGYNKGVRPALTPEVTHNKKKKRVLK
eukprot:1433391-Prymnesium_polylepis.1